MRETAVRGTDMAASWGMALIAALLALMVARFFFGISWSGSVFLGGVAFVVLGGLFHALFLVPLPQRRSTAPMVMTKVIVPTAVAPEAPMALATPMAAAAPVVPMAAVAPVVPVAEPLPPVAPDGKPALYDAPRGGVPDDLKQIRGVGPKMEAMLNRMGIWHFAQVASWRSEEVAWVDASLDGFKGRVLRDGWVAQARVLAAGGETAFSRQIEGGDVH